MRYFIQLSYSGTNYHGWQFQPNAISVQETIEKAFSTILRKKIKITGAGRTDSGVHAEFYIAHFDYHKTIIDIEKNVFRLNSFLPADIAIEKIFHVHDDLHARFSAVARTYEYRIITKKNPFLYKKTYRLYKQPDFDLMNKAAKILLEYNDFTSFSKLHTDTKTNLCKIYLAELIVHKNKNDKQNCNIYIFRIKADRFLRNMVRAITGTLLDVAYSKIDFKGFRKIIESKNRSNAGFSVPAQALFLTNIEYKFNNYK